VGVDAARVVVHVRCDEAGSHDCEEQEQAGLPPFEKRAQIHGAAVGQSLCRSIVITSSAVMMPAMRPCSSTTASVIRLYLSKSAATSSCGVSGAHAMYVSLNSDSWTAGDEIAIFTSGTTPTSFWPGPVR